MVDLGGYIIILTNDDGKIKLYGSPADNADTLEVGDEILEVNGRTLENATHNEVIQYIHQCIKSRTICLRVRRRSGNKMEELDGPNAGRIRDAWVIAVERSARERLQKLTALKKIQPRDIQAILHQQINDAVASTSEDSAAKDVTNGQITVTLADKELGTNAFSTKLSNGTIPKGLAKEADIRVEHVSQERKDVLEKQHSYEEANLLQPVQGGRIGERRASSPFQNGRTEVLIGEPEGGPRSPRGSTSSAVNDGNFLNPPDERDEPICRSRRRSNSGVTDIHSQQQQQLQENNNSSSRDAKKPQEGLGPDEMWAPGALGHHRELPVDVPDTLLQKAYPNKVKNRSSDYRNGLQHRPRSASDLDLSLNLKNETLKTRITPADGRARLGLSNDDVDDVASRSINGLQSMPMLKIELKIEDEGEKKIKVARKEVSPNIDNKYRDSPIATDSPDLKSALKALGEYENVDEDAGGQKESGVDVEDDYPFAKEDYPTMLKTCSDDSASPRSSSGRSDSTAPLDTSLRCELEHNKNKDKPKDVRHTSYDVRRIDLGSPCRSVMPDIKIAPLFGRARDTTSFDNPAYGLTDLQDLQGLLRSDETSDMTRLIDDQCSSVPRIPKDQDKAPPPVRAEDQPSEPTNPEHSANKSGAKNTKRSANVDERAKLKENRRLLRSLDIEELIRAGSTDDLLGIELTHLSSSSPSSARKPKKKHRHQQISSGYSTLKSEASGDLERDRSFLVVSDSRSYREVAVDCPPDFVPVAKRHPVYPPPNKTTTPGNSKHNTLEPKRDRESAHIPATTTTTTTTTTIATTITTTALVASPRLPPNDNSRYTTLSSGDDGSATVDRKRDARKVRSRVKSLIVDGLHSIMHNEHRRSLCYASPSTHRLNALTRPRSNEPVLQSYNMNSGEFSVTSPCSSKKLFRENPCFDMLHDEDVRRDVFLRRKFRGNVGRPFSSSSLRDEIPEDWRNPFRAEDEDEGGTIFSSSSRTIDDPARSADLSLSVDQVANSSECLLADFQKDIREVESPFSDWPRKISARERNPSSLPDVPFLKVADPPTRLSFVQETNQNSRNSLHELSSAAKRNRVVARRLFDVNDVSDDFQRSRRNEEPRDRCDSPNTQNRKNTSLSLLAYKCSELPDRVVSFDGSGAKSRACRRSMSDTSDLTAVRTRFLLSLPYPKNTRYMDLRHRPMTLHDDSDGCTKQRSSNERTSKGHTRESTHVDSLEQVNRNGTSRLDFDNFLSVE